MVGLCAFLDENGGLINRKTEKCVMREMQCCESSDYKMRFRLANLQHENSENNNLKHLIQFLSIFLAIYQTPNKVV